MFYFSEFIIRLSKFFLSAKTLANSEIALTGRLFDQTRPACLPELSCLLLTNLKICKGHL